MNDEMAKDIEIAYGSFEQPNWSFVGQRLKAAPYEDILRELRNVGRVFESTDPNDDCSRCFFVSWGVGEGLTIRLSLVGKYACIHDSDGKILTETCLGATEVGARLYQILKSSEVILLSESCMREEVVFGGESKMLYVLLFSSDELLA